MQEHRSIQEVKSPSTEVIRAIPGIVCYPLGGVFGPRVQVDYQLVMVDTGLAEVWIDGVHHLIPHGHVALLKPGHTERFVFAKDQETWHRWIAVSAFISNSGDRER